MQTTRYRYDALGRRIDKSDAFGRTSFVYDGDLLAGEIRGSKVSDYLYEPDSFVPLAKLESKAKRAPAQETLARGATKEVANAEVKAKDFAVYYYQCDQIGAPQELTDEAGRIVWAASYKVWGETQALQILRTGTGTDGEVAVFTAPERPLALAPNGEVRSLNFVEQPLRFQGQYFDGETGLHYNRFRYYDPVTGRFVHQDPIGLKGGINFFDYGPNPLEWFDPLGLSRKKTPAQKAADRAQKKGKCTGAAAQLVIGKSVFTDVSGKVRDLLPEVRKALDNVPLEERAPWHGACAEVGCVNQARKKGMDTTGGHSDAVNVGGKKHGEHKKACSSCRNFLNQFGICHDDE